MVDALVEVQVGAWLMHLFMVQADYRLFGTGWCMLDALRYLGENILLVDQGCSASCWNMK
jgi:hypothetical protein